MLAPGKVFKASLILSSKVLLVLDFIDKLLELLANILVKLVKFTLEKLL